MTRDCDRKVGFQYFTSYLLDRIQKDEHQEFIHLWWVAEARWRQAWEQKLSWRHKGQTTWKRNHKTSGIKGIRAKVFEILRTHMGDADTKGKLPGSGIIRDLKKWHKKYMSNGFEFLTVGILLIWEMTRNGVHEKRWSILAGVHWPSLHPLSESIRWWRSKEIDT